MSIEWRVVIVIGSLFLLGPNLIYLYIIWYLIFVDDEDVKVSLPWIRNRLTWVPYSLSMAPRGKQYFHVTFYERGRTIPQQTATYNL